MQHPYLLVPFPNLPSPHKTQIPISPVMDNQPQPRINAIIVARYAPLVLPHNLRDVLYNYIKHLPNYNGEDEVFVEEHLTTFYSFA